jgi:hypothetical protein
LGGDKTVKAFWYCRTVFHFKAAGISFLKKNLLYLKTETPLYLRLLAR